jgi:hypothetical protein
MAEDSIAYDKSDLRRVYGAFKAMDAEAVAAAKRESNALATYLQGKIQATASSMNNRAAAKIAGGSRVSKSAKTGELSLGFASQKLSGGGTTQINQGERGGIGILGGFEFGSNKFKQFPVWSGSGKNGGSKGWFIYPTLRAEQPYIINEWENAFSKILKEW